MDVHGFTVYDLLRRSALNAGADPALIQGGRSISYGELLQRVDRLAGGLAALDIGKGERVCIVAQNDAAYVELYGACARQGMVAYPINWRLTAEEVGRILERAAPALVVVDTGSLPLVQGARSGGPPIRHWAQWGGTPAPGFQPWEALYRDAVPARPEVEPDDPFAVISTAAVDVIPRGAVLTHRNVHCATLQTLAALGFTARDRYLVGLPLFHITALGGLLTHLHAGGANVVVPRFDAEEAVRLIDAHHITHLSDFPPVLAGVLDAARKLGSRLPSLTHVSGLDTPATMQRLIQETGAQFWTGFGQSETSGFVTLQRVADHPGTAGKAAPLCQVKVVDEFDRDVPPGTAGEILVRGPVVFQGYYAQPDVTAYTFRGGWHHTGDVGRFDEQGYLTYVKRKAEKELIKPGGENVYPAEVETVIMQMPGVSACCVFGVPDAQWGEAIKAVVEFRAAPAPQPQQVIDFVAARIARFKKPKTVALTESLPRTAEGAVDREAVKARWGQPS